MKQLTLHNFFQFILELFEFTTTDSGNKLQRNAALKLMVLFILPLLSFSAKAQFAITYPTPVEGMTVCLNQGKLFLNVEARPATTTTDVLVTVTMAPGVTYVPSSLVNTSSIPVNTYEVVEHNISNLAAPVFRVVNAGTTSSATLSFGHSVRFNISRQAGCAARVHSLNAGVCKDAITAAGTAGSSSETAPTINNYNVRYPSLTFTQPATITNAVIGSTYNRTFSIANGALGAANNLYFSITYPSGGITLNSVTLTGFGVITPTSVVGNTYNYTVTGAQLGSDNLLTNGESLSFTENITLRACSPNTNYFAGWGCDAAPASWCQTVNGTSSVAMANGVPNVRYTSHVVTQRPDFCNNMILEAKITNIATETVPGSATAYSLLQRFGMDEGEAINFRTPLQGTNFELSNGTGGWIPLVHTQGTPGTPANVSLTQLTTNPGATSGLVDADGDGQFDDLRAGASIVIRYTVVVPCQEACGSQSLSGNASTQTTFNNQCGVQTIGNKLLMNGIVPNGTRINDRAPNSVMLIGPSDINNGETVLIRFNGTKDFYLGGSHAWDCPTNQLVLRVAVPKGFSLASGTYFPSGTLSPTTNTVSTSTISGTTHDTLVVIGTGTLNYNNYSFEIGLSLNCALYTGGDITYTIHYVCDVTNNCGCEPIWRCGSIPLVVHCPDPCPEGGLTPHLSQLTRTTAGYATPYSYNTNTFANINTLSLAQRKLALPYDTIVGKVNGRMIPNTTGATITGHYYKMSYNLLGGNPVFAAQGLKMRVKDITTGTSQSCFIPAPSSNTTTGGLHTITYNLGSCGIPINNNDSVFVEPVYTVLNNTSLPASPAPLSGLLVQLYSTTTVPGQKLSCDTYSAQMNLHRLVSTRFEGTGSLEKLGCTTGRYSGNYFSNSAVLYDLYPGEIRTQNYIDSIRINILTNDIVIGNIELRSFGLTGDGYSTNSGVITNITPFATFTNNGSVITLVNDGSWPLGEHSNGASNSGYRITFNVANGCQSLASGNIAVNYFCKQFAYAQNPAVKNNIISSSGRVTTNSMPSITLTDQTGLVQAASPTESWVVRIANPTLQNAPYTWLAIPTQTSASVVSVTDIATNTVIPAISYAGGVWYQLSNTGLPAASQRNYRIDFNYSSCTLDSLRVLSGWNCGSFPADPDAYLCNANQLWLKFRPSNAEIEVTRISVPTSVDLCDKPTFVYKINNAQASNVVLNTFTINALTGVVIDPASIQAEYPSGSGNWQNVTSSVVGGNTVVNLTTHPAYPALGIPGVLKATTNEQRQINVRFSFETNCSFESGSSFTVSTAANAPCGAPAVGSSVPLSQNIKINGLPPLTATNSVVILNDLESCSASSTVRVTTQYAGEPTSATGQYEIILPPFVEYIPGSFSCVSGPCPSFVSATTQPDNSQLILLSIPSGITTGSTVEFTLNIKGNPLASCGTFPVQVNTTDQLTGITCASAPGGVCSSISVITGSKIVDINIKKPGLKLTAVDVKPCEYNGNVDLIVNMEVSNLTSTSQITGQNTVIDFYCGDGSGNIVGGKIHTHTMSKLIAGNSAVKDTITISPSACGSGGELISVISQASNCICANDTSKITIVPYNICAWRTTTTGDWMNNTIWEALDCTTNTWFVPCTPPNNDRPTYIFHTVQIPDGSNIVSDSLRIETTGRLEVCGTLLIDNEVIFKVDENGKAGQIINNCGANTCTVTVGPAATAIVRKSFSSSSTVYPWNFVSFPFNVVQDSIFIAGTRTKALWGNIEDDVADFFMAEYDGQRRADYGISNGSNYVNVPDHLILANKGYILAGGDGIDSIDFKSAIGTDFLCGPIMVPTNINVSSTGRTYCDEGWNLVGVPYVTGYNLNNAWPYEPFFVWNGVDNYTTVMADDDFNVYPFSSFFIQDWLQAYDGLTYDIEGKTFKAVKAANKFDEISLTVSNSQNSDLTRIRLKEDALVSFERKNDGIKLMSPVMSVPQIYTEAQGSCAGLACNALPLNTERVDLKVRTGKAGTYKIVLVNKEKLKDVIRLMLVDTETKAQTNLMEQSYTFDITATTTAITSRFYVTLHTEEVSSTEIVNGNGINVYTAGNKVYLSGINGKAGVNMFDAAGKLICNFPVVENNIPLTISTPGLYIMDINTENGNVRTKLIINNK